MGPLLGEKQLWISNELDSTMVIIGLCAYRMNSNFNARVWIVHENVATLSNTGGNEVTLLNVILIKSCSPVPNLKSELGLLRTSVSSHCVSTQFQVSC